MFGRKRGKREEKRESVEEMIQNKMITASYVNPSVVEEYNEIINQSGEMVTHFNRILPQHKKKKVTKHLKKLGRMFDGESMAVVVMAIELFRMEVHTTGFLKSKIKTPEEIIRKNFELR